jgi:two-component system nitrogen regulation response regulator GlnG
MTAEELDIINRHSLEELARCRLEAYFSMLGREGAARAGDVHRVVMAQVEKPLLTLALRICGGNKLDAAAMLGINRNTLLNRMRRLGLPTQPRYWRSKG